jgi:hypothetical protein
MDVHGVQDKVEASPMAPPQLSQPPPPMQDAPPPLGHGGPPVQHQLLGQVGLLQEQHKRGLEDADEAGKRKARRVQVKNKCEHDRWKDGRCKDCLCKHKVKRGDCKEGCNEASRNFCIHDRRKHGCKECFPASFCQHGKKKRRCAARAAAACSPAVGPGAALRGSPRLRARRSDCLCSCPGAASAATPHTLTSVRTTAGRGSVKSAAALRSARCVLLTVCVPVRSALKRAPRTDGGRLCRLRAVLCSTIAKSSDVRTASCARTTASSRAAPSALRTR